MDPSLNVKIQIDARYSFLPHLTGRTHYHRVGPKDGPIVVMVCGATLPMAVWEPLVAPLVDAGFQTVRYDLPGRGHTPLEGFRIDFQAHLDQLHHLLDGLKIQQPVHLIGLASGALIAAVYAARNRARVSRVCLIAPDGALTRFTFVERLLSVPVLGALVFRFNAQRTMVARIPRYSSRADIQAFVHDLLDFSLRSAGFYQSVLATVRTFPLHDGLKHYALLAESGISTNIVWGSKDGITPIDTALGSMYGEGALHILENVGHLPFVEDPKSVTSLLKRHFQNAR